MEPPSKLRTVLDTNLVLKDIWYSSGQNTKTALQDTLQKAEYWAFMAEPVFQEVEKKLRILCRGDVDKQVALWRTAYVPYIWTVRLKGSSYQDDPRIQAMRDPDDIPTAQLFLFLLPEFLFSEDRHLKAFPKSRELGPVSAAYRDIIDIHRQIQAVGFLPLGGIAISSEIWKAFRQLPSSVQIVLGGAAVGALLLFGPSFIRNVSHFLKDPEAQRMLDTLSTNAQSKLSQLSQASKYIQEQLPPAHPAMCVRDHLIEILSVIDETLSLEDIYLYLLARGYQPKGTSANSKQYVLSVLKKHALFSGSSWQLAETSS